MSCESIACPSSRLDSTRFRGVQTRRAAKIFVVFSEDTKHYPLVRDTHNSAAQYTGPRMGPSDPSTVGGVAEQRGNVQRAACRVQAGQLVWCHLSLSLHLSPRRASSKPPLPPVAARHREGSTRQSQARAYPTSAQLNWSSSNRRRARCLASYMHRVSSRSRHCQRLSLNLKRWRSVYSRM